MIGNIEGGNDQKLVLYDIRPDATNFLDTIKMDETGRFNYRLTSEIPIFLRLNFNAENFIFLLVKPGEKINVKARLNDLQESYEVEGSPSSLELRTYMKQFVFAYREKLRIAEMYRSRVESGDSVLVVRKEARELHLKMKNEIVSFTKDFIRKNKCSLATPFILDLQLGKNDPILTMEKDFEYFAMVDTCLSKNYPELQFVQDFNRALVQFNEEKRIFDSQQLKLGTKAPDIELSNQNGDTLKLSSEKGKYILVAFWGSWNNASRMANKELLKLHEKYFRRGFTIFQVGFETNEADWLKAIEADGIFWTQVRDLKLWDSYLVNLYQVYNVPSYYLLSPDQTILEISNGIQVISDKLETVFN